MTKEEKLKYVQELIYTDYDHPKTARDLAYFWQTDKRGVRTIVNELRCAGVPICSDNKGYWYATTPEEMLPTVRRIRAHALKELKAMSKMLRACRTAGLEI